LFTDTDFRLKHLTRKQNEIECTLTLLEEELKQLYVAAVLLKTANWLYC